MFWLGGSWTASYWYAGNWLGPNDAGEFAGLQASVLQGVLTPSIEVALVGQQAGAAGGALGASVGSGGNEVALTGQQAVAAGGSFFGVRYEADDDLFALQVVTELVAVSVTDDLLTAPVVLPLSVVVVDTEPASTSSVDDLWAQQQVEELLALLSDNELVVFTEE